MKPAGIIASMILVNMETPARKGILLGFVLVLSTKESAKEVKVAGSG